MKDLRDEAATGVRFSLNYLSRGGPLKDGERFRRRLYRLFSDVALDPESIAIAVEYETGARVPWGGYGHDWEDFFQDAELRDILDAITVIWRLLGPGGRGQTWLRETGRIFREENLGYRCDEKAGVHFAVDDEFQRNWASTISGLGLPRYGAARAAFEAAQASFDMSPPSGREAIRHTFDAVENVFRLVLGSKVSRLGSTEIQKSLRPLVLSLHEGTAREGLNKLISAFADWVDGAHPYRHAQGVEAMEVVPLEVAVLFSSLGASILRWLIELDLRIAEKRA
ncbi:hypothetical protein ACFO0A_03385 [Novosphingobium tardum]|uniref:Apea-like HEPN domain-containing protein n=1 Tax=Novosphingobium tardum TaxID=1538021 RepID=A0ABV8RLY8_9SPHN